MVPVGAAGEVLQVYVIVVRKHRADYGLAESLRAQEHRSLAWFKLADVAGVVHDKAFADKFGPVYDAIRNLALVLHAE